jgi:hypothetical protein
VESSEVRVLGIAQLDPEICEIHFTNGLIAIIKLQQKNLPFEPPYGNGRTSEHNQQGLPARWRFVHILFR